MIVLKYGKAKKLEYAKRWKCKCSECGCKVILDKDDIQNYKNDTDSGGHRFTKFDWTCPYCGTELHYEEYDNRLVNITESIKDFALDHCNGLCRTAVVLIVVLLSFVVGIALDQWYNHYDNTYNYRIEYIEDDGDHRIDWTNEIEENGQYIIYIDENGHKKKQALDTSIVIDLKEEKDE